MKGYFRLANADAAWTMSKWCPLTRNNFNKLGRLKLVNGGLYQGYGQLEHSWSYKLLDHEGQVVVIGFSKED